MSLTVKVATESLLAILKSANKFYRRNNDDDDDDDDDDEQDYTTTTTTTTPTMTTNTTRRRLSVECHNHTAYARHPRVCLMTLARRYNRTLRDAAIPSPSPSTNRLQCEFPSRLGCHDPRADDGGHGMNQDGE
uniref:Uncharacterized protein n=1 Tax=Vespula pensylvanica TaxID=30213 RepID=A0A834PE02_VESPE|nr:hypothetical protein H0235_000265 [Vespula pensylvanica]